MRILFFILFTPFPLGDVHGSGMLDFHPHHVTEVVVPTWDGLERPPVLEKLFVRNGQRVKEGDDLATFSHAELQNKRMEAETELGVREGRIRVLVAELRETTDKKQIEELNAEKAKCLAQKAVFESELKLCQDLESKLHVKAPVAGVVLSSPWAEEVGKQWDRNFTMFCKIGDPNRLRAVVSISASDFRLLRDKGDVGTANPTVTIQIGEREVATCHGRLVRLEEAAPIPRQLTTRGGGPIAVKPNDSTQRFLVHVDLDADNAGKASGMGHGTAVHATIQCGWRSIAWWLWQKFSCNGS